MVLNLQMTNYILDLDNCGLTEAPEVIIDQFSFLMELVWGQFTSTRKHQNI